MEQLLGWIYHWIYCLPRLEAVALALLFTSVFLWMRHKLERHRFWRWCVAGLLLIWTAVILMQTVLMRTVDNSAPSLVPFRCYITVLRGGEKELLRSAFMNVLMFYPGGLLSLTLWRRKYLLPLLGGFLVLSVGIEALQFLLGVGVAETDDVIHNVLGAALGLLVARQYGKHAIKA